MVEELSSLQDVELLVKNNNGAEKLNDLTHEDLYDVNTNTIRHARDLSCNHY